VIQTTDHQLGEGYRSITAGWAQFQKLHALYLS